MSTIDQRILNILSDGQFHSGEKIASSCGLSRTAIWKHIKALNEIGADIYCVKGKGYRILGGLDVLKLDVVKDILSKFKVDHIGVEILTSIASTNTYLKDSKLIEDVQVCAAEYQSSGKGRLGKVWHSPFAKNIYFSFRKVIPRGFEELSGLSLVVGCSVVKVLNGLGINQAALKWPNDIKINGAKVGGVLIELSSALDGSTDITIGVGLNWDMPSNNQIDQDWGNILSETTIDCDRNEVLANLIMQLDSDLNEFSKTGFLSFQEFWDSVDELKGKVVHSLSSKNPIKGICLGVDEVGALLIQSGSKLHRMVGGEVSVREV